jgi:hypothetical protein
LDLTVVPTYRPALSTPLPPSTYIGTTHFFYTIWGKIGEELGRKNIRKISLNNVREKNGGS